MVVLEQVEEQHKFCLVGDRRRKTFTGDYMPSSRLVLQVGVRLNLRLNLRRQIFVYFALDRRLLHNCINNMKKLVNKNGGCTYV